MAARAPIQADRWAHFNEEILKHCVDENHSYEETKDYMEENFGFKASIRQYKDRYKGYKNMKFSEWVGISKVYSQRAQQGKASELWNRGRRVDPSKVSRQLERYKSEILQHANVTIATSVLDPRLSIRTPPPTDRAADNTPPPSTEPNTIAISPFIHEMSRQTARPQPSSDPELDIDICLNEPLASTLHLDFDFFSSFIHDGQVPERENWQATMPCFQLENILAVLRNQMSPSTTNVSRSSSALTKVSVYDRQALLAGLLGDPSNDISTSTAVLTLTSQLSEVFPEHSEGDIVLAVRRFLDPTNKDPLEDLFKFACYFFSNNTLTKDQKLAFMKWVVENNYTQRLASFLTIQSIAVDGFRSGVIASIMDMADLRLVTQLVEAGVSFDEILAQSTGVSDQKYFDSFIRYGLDQDVFHQLSGRTGTLVLVRATESKDEELLVRLLNAPVSPDLLSGKAGGNLLCLVVKKGYSKASKALINKRCDLDSYPIDGAKSTPLGLAVWLGHTDIVKCLVEGGANLGLVSYHDRNNLLPLALAVKRGKMEVITALVEGGAGFDCKINGFDIFRWSSKNNANVHRLLCRLSGREDTVEKSEVTVSEIVRVADRGPGLFTGFHEEHRADLTDELLEEALCLAAGEQLVLATSTLLSAGVDPKTPKFSPKAPAISRALLAEPEKWEEKQFYDYHLIVELLVNAGGDPNYETVTDDLFSVICDASLFNAYVMETLLSGGLDCEKYGPRVLCIAIYGRDTNTIIALIEKGVSPNNYAQLGYDEGYMTPLQQAACYGRINYIEYFLQHGGDINMPAWSLGGKTALQAACGMSHDQTVRYLIEKGADVNALPAVTRGFTALEASLHWSDGTGLFELLLEHGALINQHHGRASHILCRLILRKTHDQNLFQLVERVLEAGADPNEMPTEESEVWSNYQMTPVQQAAGRANLELVKLLVPRGGDINRPPWRNGGRTALQAAASHEKPQLELVQYLLGLGAEINAPPAATGGLTALQGASIRGHVKIVLLLLESGADPNARPALENGRTAVGGAAEHGRLDVVKLLLNAGARPYRWGKQSGFQAEIELAEGNRHFAAADLLRSHEREFCEAF
ncbi:ankyrin repeat-containing domain protein [Cladorrhinum sp. PSN259]|nr:ankyrin repeat-containing domain protein [Cladorrhinum sp. PSN259]